MKPTFQMLLFLIILLGCQPKEQDNSHGSRLEQVVDTLSFREQLATFSNEKLLQEGETALLEDFIAAFGQKLATNWTYAEVLRRAKGRAKMVDQGMKGQVLDLVEKESRPGDSLAHFILSLRCQNALPAAIDVFSIWVTIHDQQGKLIYTTTYLTNVQPMNVGEWSAVMPFEIKVRHRNAAKMKAFRAITKGHSEGIYTFKMAYVKFTDGPTLDEYWLSPDQ